MPEADEADRFDLQRFVHAQSASFEAALAALRSGGQHSGWSWCVLSHLCGLGTRPLSLRCAIPGPE